MGLPKVIFVTICNSITGRSYGKRQGGGGEVESIGRRALARWDRGGKAAEVGRSTTAGHVANEGHVIDWSGAKVLEREGHRKTRQVKESIWVRKEPNSPVDKPRILT